MATLTVHRFKRIHLFEFEDFAWFPDWIRNCMTRYLNAFHKLLRTSELLAGPLARALQHAETPHILDLCSGSGGPVPEAVRILREKRGFSNLSLTLSDRYPDLETARRMNAAADPALSYFTTPLDATAANVNIRGVRSMVSSLHHMKPADARQILASAQAARQPICIFEISDNAAPIFLWWLALPIAFLTVFFVTPLVRPLRWQQLVFTYLIPLLPLFIAWDGAVSNARTYSLPDLEILTRDLQSIDYRWEMGKLKGRGGSKLFLLGLPRL